MNTVKRIQGVSRHLMAIAGLTVGSITMALGVTQLSEAKLYFELNDTAGDLGIHSSIDGGPYVELEIEDRRGRTIFSLEAGGSLAQQGVTQLFFESAEPNFSQLSPAKFFRRFPEGKYVIEAETRAGEVFGATVCLSHVMAARAGNITVSGIPLVNDSDVPSVSEPVIIRWDPVTTSHPTIGKAGPVEIAMYQFFVEGEGFKLGVELPPTVTEFQVPSEILALGSTFKFEIIATTDTDNNTAVEHHFTLLDSSAVSMVTTH